MAETDPHVRKSKTLYVRNLPFSTTNSKLEEVFGDIGPLKQCFVVKDKNSDKCRGFGYVTFSLFDDAEKAKDTVKSLDGRKLTIVYANRKKDSRQKKKVEESKDKQDTKDAEVSDSDDDEEEKPASQKDEKAVAKSKGTQEMKYLRAKTVLVTGWKENTYLEKVQKCIQKLNVKNISKVEFPARDRTLLTALVRFKSIRDTKRGQRKLHGKEVKGATLKAVQMTKEPGQVKEAPQWLLKRNRLIVRNLSFRCKESDLQRAFEKFGDISEARIPLQSDGKMYGFGFVQFSNFEAANKAIAEMNNKMIIGRRVAVDWSVAKDKFVAASESSKKESESDSDGSSDSEKEKEAESDEGSFSADSKDKSQTKKSKEVVDSEDESESDEDSSDEEESSEEDSDEGFDESSDDDEGIKQTQQKKNKKAKPARKSDVEEGRTLFIRNISFETEEEELQEKFSEYGKLNYCKLLVDPNTDHSRGTAFVQFRKLEDAENCLQQSEDDSKNGGISLDGRRLNVVIAVTRTKAQDFKEKKEKVKQDKRNLHLAREGMIRPGTQAAIGLTKEDLAKRTKLENVKRQKLKQPNIFISTTRLSIHNIPVHVDEKHLKQMMLEAAGNKMAVVNECRIMRDMARVNSQGVGKSRGFGFVNFTEHKDALEALRSTNNNPDLFGEKKRLIVEFSLENKAALEAKEKRMERVKARQESLKKQKENQDQSEAPVVKSKKTKVKNVKLTDKFIGNLKLPEGSDGKKIPKGLPSHWGPKVRHKARPQQQTKKKQAKGGNAERGKAMSQGNSKRKLDNSISEDLPKTKKRKQAKDQTDNFDKLVNKYKQNLMKKADRSKWFES